MIQTLEDLQLALAQMELHRGDTLSLEAKTFSEYSANALGPTLSAFANLPGGGSILLGVSESDGVSVVGVDDAHALIQSAVSQARNGFSTEIRVEGGAFTIDGRTVAVLNVSEAPVNEKPCRWNKRKKSYIRQYDGDYAMSPQEEQQLLLRHGHPREDSKPVDGSSRADLNADLVAAFTSSVRRSTSRMADVDDDVILYRMNIVTGDGRLTTAGLYALGEYPQRLLPHLTLTAAIEGSGGARAVNRRNFVGPIPEILDDALDWVMRNVDSAQVVTSDGVGTTNPSMPELAVREVVTNALVHRDLSEPASGKGIDLRLGDRELRLTNPGGLWGVTVDQLGTQNSKSAVNEFLYTICQNVESRHGRVIEALGSGIAAARDALREAGLPEPRFFDNGVSFTVLFPSSSLLPESDLAWLGSLGASGLSHRQSRALVDMRHGTVFTNSAYRARFGVSADEARADLADLVRRGLAERSGERRWVKYRLPSRL